MCSGARRRQAVESAAATSRERPLAASSLSSHSTQPLPCRRRLELLVLATSQSKSPTTPNRRARAQTTTSKRTRKQASHTYNRTPPPPPRRHYHRHSRRAKLNRSVALGALTYKLRLDMVHSLQKVTPISLTRRTRTKQFRIQPSISTQLSKNRDYQTD